jgi:hypothetical protein
MLFVFLEASRLQSLNQSVHNEFANSVNAGSYGSTFYQSADQLSNDSETSILKFRINKSKMMIDNQVTVR